MRYRREPQTKENRAMNDNALDDQILTAIRSGHATRKQMMQIDTLRIRSWAAIGEHLNILTRRGALVATKTGWRLAN
jgi:hypothetical protein